MIMVMGWYAGKVHWSAIPVEVGDGEPRGSRGTRGIGRLEVTKVPGNGHAGIRVLSPKKVMGLLAQLKCIYSNACTMGNLANPKGLFQLK